MGVQKINKQNLINIFIDIYKLILKFMRKRKCSRRINVILKKKKNIGGITNPDVKGYYTAVFRTMLF